MCEPELGANKNKNICNDDATIKISLQTVFRNFKLLYTGRSSPKVVFGNNLQKRETKMCTKLN